MKVKITFKNNFLAKLKESTDSAKINEMINWPDCSVTFADEETEQKIEFEPDIALAWLDSYIGGLEHPESKLPDDDIWGIPLDIKFTADTLKVVDRETNQQRFETKVSRKELLSSLIVALKRAQDIIETTNPRVREDEDWKSYYFVNNYERNQQ